MLRNICSSHSWQAEVPTGEKQLSELVVNTTLSAVACRNLAGIPSAVWLGKLLLGTANYMLDASCKM